MKIPFLTDWLARRGRRRVRHIMRGYRVLKVAGQLDRISVIKDVLTITPLRGVEDRVSRFILGAGAGHAEQAIRQYLLMRIGGLSLNEALLSASGTSGARVVHPLPAQWRSVLRGRGFRVAGLRSACAWYGFIGVYLAYGIVRCWSRLLEGLANVIRPKAVSLGDYAYFDSLAAPNLPQPCSDGRSHDVITWYAQWRGRRDALSALCHGVRSAAASSVAGIPVVPMPSPIPRPVLFSEWLRYVAWTILAITITILDLLRGRWWHALLLAEASSAAVVRVGNAKDLARDYLLHNSGWIYRPLWTYEAERKGARILFYFYSTNCEGFKLPDRYPPVYYGYRAMNWPQYLVWDEQQADFVRRAVGYDANVNVVGPVWFHTSSREMLPSGRPAIAAFDVTSVRASFYAALALDTEFYLPGVSVKFLEDIRGMAQANGYDVYWKRKRNIGALTHATYRKFAEQFSALNNVSIVDPEVSAYRVIEASEMIISMPFTSTALIARELGKPSCYYDPTGQLQTDDRAAHGIPIIRGASELGSWIREHATSPSQIRATN